MEQGLGSRETVGQVTDTSSVSSGVVTVQFRDRTDTEVKVEDLNLVQESKLLAKYKRRKRRRMATGQVGALRKESTVFTAQFFF